MPCPSAMNPLAAPLRSPLVIPCIGVIAVWMAFAPLMADGFHAATNYGTGGLPLGLPNWKECECSGRMHVTIDFKGQSTYECGKCKRVERIPLWGE